MHVRESPQGGKISLLLTILDLEDHVLLYILLNGPLYDYSWAFGPLIDYSEEWNAFPKLVNRNGVNLSNRTKLMVVWIWCTLITIVVMLTHMKITYCTRQRADLWNTEREILCMGSRSLWDLEIVTLSYQRCFDSLCLIIKLPHFFCGAINASFRSSSIIVLPSG